MRWLVLVSTLLLGGCPSVTVGGCPGLASYPKEFQQAVAKQYAAARQRGDIEITRMIDDYGVMREETRICRGTK